MSLQTASFLDVAVKWTDELRIYGEGFVGRREELEALDQAWADGVRIFALHAEGGAGKTRVVVEWLRRMRDEGWRGARRVFVHSFYSQGSDERRNASSELFFEQALAFFGYRGEPITQADERGRMLARLLLEQQGLLVLDGLEPLQHPTQHAERGRLKDPGVARLLLSLANVPRGETRGLCLITSRQPVIELQGRAGATVVQQSLDHLHRADGAELLRQFEIVGPDEELRQASDEFHGHAYSLMLLGSFLRNATDHHDIRRRREVVLLEEDTEQGGHARKMFAAYVRHLGEDSPEVAVLRLLGFFDRPAERNLLDVLRAREGVVYQWPEEPRREREFVQRMRELGMKNVEDALAGLDQQALDVFQDRILRGTYYDGFYSSKKLGAMGADLGAVACFFETPWAAITPKLASADQKWLLNSAAMGLRALGQLTDALEPLQQGIAMAVEQPDWKNAAIFSGNLSELELYRGEISAAVDAANQAVLYARKWRDPALNMLFRTTLADALHQAGQRDEAQRKFENAERRQASFQPDFPYLYSVQGFRYCEFLLSDAERDAWRCHLLMHRSEDRSSASHEEIDPEDEPDTFAEVSARAKRSLAFFTGKLGLLSLAMDHLTLARATLYMTELAVPFPDSAVDHMASAIDGIRASGQTDFLPRGLLTRAWIRFLSKDEPGSREDLDEAWEIAARGPMPLFQADIHLYRARLFRDRAALEEARRLIEKHGYHRRDGELADALAAAEGW